MKDDSAKKKDKADNAKWSFIEKSSSLIISGKGCVKGKGSLEKTDYSDNLSEIEPDLGSILSHKQS